MDDIIFKLENFEGPMDLLLKLIETHKIDIYNIPIAELTDSYLEYLQLLKQADMEGLSEFIVMAATLIEIKSRILLPLAEDDEEDDPREELVRRLIEYKQYKEAAVEFDKRQQQKLYPVFKEPDNEIKQEILKDSGDRDISDILDGADGDMLFKAFKEVMRRREVRVDRVRSGFDHIEKDPYTVEDKVEYIKGIISTKKQIVFEELFEGDSTKNEIITTFLAVLELIKGKYIDVTQEKIFGKILINFNENNDEEKNGRADMNVEAPSAENEILFKVKEPDEDDIMPYEEEPAAKNESVISASIGYSIANEVRGIISESFVFDNIFNGEEGDYIESERKGGSRRGYIVCRRRRSRFGKYCTSHWGGRKHCKGAYRKPCLKIRL